MEEKEDRKSERQLNKELREKFLKENGYVEIDPKTLLRPCCAKILDDYDPRTHDAWLMQCPKGMDLQPLVGKYIKMPGRRYIGNLQVRATPNKTPSNDCVGYVNSKGEYALRKMPIVGQVTVSKRLNQLEAMEPDEFPTAPPPPTFNLPVRHPLFGRDYKQRIEVPPAIKKQLEEADRKSLETSARLRVTQNYYTIKSQMMATTQTLVEKEQEVRQSVLTGVTPNFMKSTAAPSLFNPVVPIVEIKRKPKQTNGIAQTNGHTLVETKQEPMSPKKQKKRSQSKGENPVNGTSVLEDSVVTIKEEEDDGTEQQPEKRKKSKKKAKGEAVTIEENVVEIKEEPTTSKKQKKRKSNGEIPVNGTSILEDSVVTIKEESGNESQPEKRRKSKKKAKGEAVTMEENVVEIKEEPTTSKKQKKRKSNGDISVNGTSNLQDSVVTIKEEEDDAGTEPQTKKRKKHKAKGGDTVTIDDVVEIKEEEEDAVPEAQTPRKKHKKLKAVA